jgi:methylglyoxal/glyoxal reductase
MSDLSIESTIRLNNGVELPRIGLGVYQSKPGPETEQAIIDALNTGYRHIDTAQAYRNEKDVGSAIRKTNIPRHEIFITTKIANNNQGYDKTIRTFSESLEVMGLEYVDMLLIHWPLEEKRRETWPALETIYDEGKTRAIGVSNYMAKHLDDLSTYARVRPAVNQVEFHPFLYLRDLLAYCRSNEIVLEAYSPLTRGKKLNHPTLRSVAAAYGKTPAQVLIRWGLQHDLVVLPKSVRRERIAENAEVFDFALRSDDMETLDSLHENLRVAWDPTIVD